jgi:hypothetical protein
MPLLWLDSGECGEVGEFRQFGLDERSKLFRRRRPDASSQNVP